MLYPVELQSRLFPERERKCRGNFEGNKAGKVPAQAGRGFPAYFRWTSMQFTLHSLHCLGLVCLLSLTAQSAWSQEEKDNPTPTELREVLRDTDRDLEERVQAYFDLKPVLTDRDESIALIDLLLEEPLTGDQRVELTVNKAKLFRERGDELEGIDLLSQLLETELKDVDRHRCKLLLERGSLESKLDSEKIEKSVSQTLDDLHEALAIAEEMDDVDLMVETHNRLGNAYLKYRDFKTAEAHYGYILLNYTTAKQLALARLNTTFLLDDSRQSHRDTALFYLAEARMTFDELGEAGLYKKATSMIARFLRAEGRLEESKQEYQRMLDQGGNQVTALEYLGYIANKQGDQEEAVKLFRQAIRLDADKGGNRAAYLYGKLGSALVDKGEPREALRLCDSVRLEVTAAYSPEKRDRATRLLDCWACISQAQRALGQFEDALLSRVKEDSCENVYQTMDRENENDLDGLEVLEWENRRKQRMQENQYKLQEERQTYLYAIVALLIGFAMFITYRYRFTQRQSQLISTQRQQLADRQRELIKANSDLEIALNHKAVFLSNMSHEIRTPLNAIVGMSNLATKEDMTTAARKYLRNIVIASSNLIDIVNDILDFSKLEAGKLEIAEEPFSVADALEVAENVMRISAEQKDLTFTVDAADNLPSHLMGDSSRLNQVLINLIGNAIKFTLEGGVTLCAEVAPLPTLPGWCPPPPKAHDEWFVVRVKDTGIGIPNDKQEKIFESFNQGDQLKTRKFGGTGLGLSISKQIVELQGGVIWVESVEGEGSTFCFALPALHTEGIAEEDHKEDADREIGPIRILIAEDNPFNVIVTEDTLKAELKEVTIGKAENGKVAFEKIRDEEWDLVLMDIHMPEMSGLEATAAIRKLPDADKARTLIVAMTASVLREETDNYMRHGMDGFVPKPFQADQLKNEIFRLQKDRKKEANPEQTSLPPLRILIAEDNPFNVIVAEDTLRTEIPNVTIGKAENGKVAMEMVRDEEWDIVLMDIAMPEMTGIEATLAIRKLEDAAKADTTIIAMTASVLKEDTDHYLKQGMNGFVPKPFKVGQLLSEIEKAHLSRKK